MENQKYKHYIKKVNGKIIAVYPEWALISLFGEIPSDWEFYKESDKRHFHEAFPYDTSEDGTIIIK